MVAPSSTQTTKVNVQRGDWRNQFPFGQKKNKNKNSCPFTPKSNTKASIQIHTQTQVCPSWRALVLWWVLGFSLQRQQPCLYLFILTAPSMVQHLGLVRPLYKLPLCRLTLHTKTYFSLTVRRLPHCLTASDVTLHTLLQPFRWGLKAPTHCCHDSKPSRLTIHRDSDTLAGELGSCHLPGSPGLDKYKNTPEIV